MPLCLGHSQGGLCRPRSMPGEDLAPSVKMVPPWEAEAVPPTSFAQECREHQPHWAPRRASHIHRMRSFPRATATNHRTLGASKMTDIDSLTILEAKSLKFRCWQGRFPLGVAREKPPWASLMASGVAGRPWPLWLCRCIAAVSASAFTWP